MLRCKLFCCTCTHAHLHTTGCYVVRSCLALAHGHTHTHTHARDATLWFLLNMRGMLRCEIFSRTFYHSERYLVAFWMLLCKVFSWLAHAGCYVVFFFLLWVFFCVCVAILVNIACTIKIAGAKQSDCCWKHLNKNAAVIWRTAPDLAWMVDCGTATECTTGFSDNSAKRQIRDNMTEGWKTRSWNFSSSHGPNTSFRNLKTVRRFCTLKSKTRGCDGPCYCFCWSLPPSRHIIFLYPGEHARELLLCMQSGRWWASGLLGAETGGGRRLV